MMKKYSFFTAIGLMAALLFTACSQDEWTDDNALPEGKYPLEIASVTMEGESSAQPWGAKGVQTRVSENEGGMGSEFQSEDAIAVSLKGETATYTYDGSKWTSNTPIYWQNKQPAPVTAWYPTDETVQLADQTQGLAYVMKGGTTENANYDTPANLTFTHQLAKVRVVLNGSQTGQVTDIKIKSLTTCTHTQGTVSESGADGWITMMPVTYNGVKYYEANVVPNHPITQFQVNGNDGKLNDNGITPEAAKVSKIILTVGAKEITGGETITTPGDYIVTGNVNETITLSSEGINLTLKDANISVSSGNGINITSGSPTIRVEGTNNTVKSSNDAGIYVAAGSTVNITGNSRSDKLTVTAGGDAAGIGGCSNKQDCGNINISKVTVIAKGSDSVAFSPGIGSTSTAQCGAITIDDATVHAYGTGVPNTCACPGIGTGGDNSGSTGTVLPAITIRNNSEVHAHRGNEYADYIGYAYWQTSGGQVRGTITGSTVYCYTGDSDTSDKTIVYDASGTATVQ